MPKLLKYLLLWDLLSIIIPNIPKSSIEFDMEYDVANSMHVNSKLHFSNA